MNRPWSSSSSSSSFVSFFALGGRTPQCTSYTDRTLGLLGFLLPFFTQPCAIQIPHLDKLWPKQFTIRETQRMYDERGWSCGVLSCLPVLPAPKPCGARAHTHTHTETQILPQDTLRMLPVSSIYPILALFDTRDREGGSFFCSLLSNLRPGRHATDVMWTEPSPGVGPGSRRAPAGVSKST